MTNEANKKFEPLEGPTDLIDKFPNSRPMLSELEKTYCEEVLIEAEQSVAKVRDQIEKLVFDGQDVKARQLQGDLKAAIVSFVTAQSRLIGNELEKILNEQN